ncbi:unnamed protein product, partial [Rotaria sp. Silwood1]
MSSRAVRKTIGHTTEDDLAQVLQKVGIDKHDNDDESDLIITRVNDHRRNVFEMLVDEDDDEKTTIDDDNQSNDVVQQQSTTSKTKRKRKIKKKNNQIQKNDQNNDDDFLIEPNESQQEPDSISTISKELFSNLLSVDNRFLNPLNEMKKKFGSSIVEQIERENNLTTQSGSTTVLAQRRRAYQMLQQRPTTRLAKQNAFIVPKLGWPIYYKL